MLNRTTGATNLCGLIREPVLVLQLMKFFVAVLRGILPEGEAPLVCRPLLYQRATLKTVSVIKCGFCASGTVMTVTAKFWGRCAFLSLHFCRVLSRETEEKAQRIV